MKDIFRSISMAFSMFSVIPMPMIEWKQENMKYMLSAFPLVGAVIGAALFIWSHICAWLNLGQLLFAAGLTLIPMGISGGIHMDGFCDTCDALGSHASPEKKRLILKDSNAGAFAVISFGAYLIAYFALASEIEPSSNAMLLCCLIPFISRCMSGFTGLTFPSSSSEGLLKTFTGAASKAALVIVLVLFALSISFACLISLLAGLLMLLGAVLFALYIYFMSRKQFGGMSGDISGYLLQMTELILLAIIVFTVKAVGL